ncbi:hypothetical protein ES705_43153 [subsurface metagenome]
MATFKFSQLSLPFNAAAIMAPKPPTAAASVMLATPRKIDPKTAKTRMVGKDILNRPMNFIAQVTCFLSSLVRGGPSSGLMVHLIVI